MQRGPAPGPLRMRPPRPAARSPPLSAPPRGCTWQVRRGGGGASPSVGGASPYVGGACGGVGAARSRPRRGAKMAALWHVKLSGELERCRAERHWAQLRQLLRHQLPPHGRAPRKAAAGAEEAGEGGKEERKGGAPPGAGCAERRLGEPRGASSEGAARRGARGVRGRHQGLRGRQGALVGCREVSLPCDTQYAV